MVLAALCWFGYRRLGQLYCLKLTSLPFSGTINQTNESLLLQVYEFDDVMFPENSRCSTCDLRKPARSKHCSKCGCWGSAAPPPAHTRQHTRGCCRGSTPSSVCILPGFQQPNPGLKHAPSHSHTDLAIGEQWTEGDGGCRTHTPKSHLSTISSRLTLVPRWCPH